MEAAVAELAGGADEALAYVQSLLPSHREDMALVEKLEELMETARRKVGGVAGRKVGAVVGRKVRAMARRKAHAVARRKVNAETMRRVHRSWDHIVIHPPLPTLCTLQSLFIPHVTPLVCPPPCGC